MKKETKDVQITIHEVHSLFDSKVLARLWAGSPWIHEDRKAKRRLLSTRDPCS